MQFRNPVNGYVETANAPGLFCLLFGPLYFLSKGVVFHAIISFVAALMTVGLSWLIYPIFAGNAVRKAYLRAGWTEVRGGNVADVADFRRHQYSHYSHDPENVRAVVRRTSHSQ